MKDIITRNVNKSFTLAELYKFQDKIEEKLEKIWYNVGQENYGRAAIHIGECLALSYSTLPTIPFECFLSIRCLLFFLIELELSSAKFIKDLLGTYIDRARHCVKSRSTLSNEQIDLFLMKMYEVKYRIGFDEQSLDTKTPELKLTRFKRLREQTIDIKHRLELLYTIALKMTSEDIDSKVYILEKIFSNCIFYSLQTIDCYLQRETFELYNFISQLFDYTSFKCARELESLRKDLNEKIKLFLKKLSINRNNNNDDKFQLNSLQSKEKHGFTDGSLIKRVSFARYHSKYEKRRSSTQSDLPNQIFHTNANDINENREPSNTDGCTFQLILELHHSDNKNCEKPLRKLILNIMEECLDKRKLPSYQTNELFNIFSEFAHFISLRIRNNYTSDERLSSKGSGNQLVGKLEYRKKSEKLFRHSRLENLVLSLRNLEDISKFLAIKILGNSIDTLGQPELTDLSWILLDRLVIMINLDIEEEAPIPTYLYEDNYRSSAMIDILSRMMDRPSLRSIESPRRLSTAPGVSEQDSAELFAKYVIFLSIKKIIEENLGFVEQSSKWFSAGILSPVSFQKYRKKNLGLKYVERTEDTSCGLNKTSYLFTETEQNNENRLTPEVKSSSQTNEGGSQGNQLFFTQI
ncbi:DgyrCDS4386 [Dimorphilus gyrociliatus]|uniref:DgyrCDS4386 n=1 Tax=Dimorphilus gyrociliatus TaxID=2664684 RepID=A0A7I8VJ33_9ANNE|nr:DgyrCDS4386 [Dimorphilus gyrociliatus]